MKIGFIGIGQMGRHMSRRILEGGYEVVLHDTRKEAAAPLLEKGASWADSPRQMAQTCRIIFTCLPTPQIVDQVVFGKDGLKAGWKAGDIYVDMSTNSPSTIRHIAADAKAMGVAVLDAPVSGGTKGAEMGTLAIMVGGDPAALEKTRKILATMGPRIFAVGPVGCGNIAKLVNNMIALTTNSITAEGFVLGVKAGIDPQMLYEIIKVSTGNSQSLDQLPATIFKGDFEPGFKLSLGKKDLGLALTLGEENDVPLSVAKAAFKMMEETAQAGLSEKSVQAVILPLEEKAGVKVRVSK
jgi:3-hydroxyisobutyrate dehydrogenase